MADSVDSKRTRRSRRVRLLAVTALLGGALVAGCGAGAPSPSATTAGGATGLAAAASGAGGATRPGSHPPALAGSALAFARCMRANGVPNFPDPVSGGLRFPAGPGNAADLSSPARKAAQAKCRKLLPGGGPPGPGSTTHPSAQTLAKLLKIARCMRGHGVTGFPDPLTSVPADLDPGTYNQITDFDGAILLFPRTIDTQAPAYRHALSVCGAPPLGLPH